MLAHCLGNRGGVQQRWARSELLKVGLRQGSWTDEIGVISCRDCKVVENPLKQLPGFLQHRMG